MAEPTTPFWAHRPRQREAERRAAVRYPCALESCCQPIPEAEDDAAWPATVRDISATGVGLLLSRPFLPGTLLNLELTDDDGGPPTTLLTEVVHVAPQGSEIWFVGCVFSRELTDGELRQLV